MKKLWSIKKLGEVTQINPSKKSVLSLSLSTPVSFVSMASINENVGTISNIQTKKLEEVKNGYTFFSDDDVLYAKITPCMENGKVAIAKNLQNGIGFGTTEVHVLRPTNQVLPEWIYSIVSRDQFRSEAEKHMTGSAGQQRVPREFLENVEIPVPPINTQKKIVEKLDAIRKAQELNDLQISKADELFQSLLHKELDPTGKDWEVKKLGEVVEVKGGKRIPKGMNFSSERTSHPYLRVVDFMGGSIRIENLKYISNEIFKFIKNYTISPKDIYISIAGTIGLVGKIPEILDGANLTENAAKILVNENKIDQDYLVFVLSTIQSRKQIEKFTQAVGVPKLALERIKKIQISIPSLKIQKQIVEKLSAVQEYKKQLLAQKLKLKELFDSVLDRCIKGEI